MVCRLIYSVELSALVALFVVVNFALLPVAFLKTLAHKLVQLKRHRNMKKVRCTLGWLILGPAYLLISQFVDAYHFICQCYRVEAKKNSGHEDEIKLRFSDFQRFRLVLTRLIE